MHDQSGLRTLTQTFRFPGATADELACVLANAPLVGERSIFGNRVAKSTTSDGDSRQAYGFQPAPGGLLRFDVEIRQLRRQTGVQVTLEFSQPHRKRPYLAGQFVWLLSDADDGAAAILREEINTPTALAIVDRPLHGHRFSLRRYLFFAGGHKRLMRDVERNIASLLEEIRLR
ncbi:MAG: hypothetical protein OEM67_10290 [Thermoleophilia bacterium]|nr:hypothetical protein [Thermoleophilia bacterium]MDH3724995.1 hypothetical protein [Thermoleophilia bacterium]